MYLMIPGQTWEIMWQIPFVLAALLQMEAIRHWFISTHGHLPPLEVPTRLACPCSPKDWPTHRCCTLIFQRRKWKGCIMPVRNLISEVCLLPCGQAETKKREKKKSFMWALGESKPNLQVLAEQRTSEFCPFCYYEFCSPALKTWFLGL